MIVNKKIVLEEDMKSSKDARVYAAKYLKGIGAGFDSEGFLYLVGPETSDLIVISPRESHKRKGPILRACTSEEWTKYFYDHICIRGTFNK